MTRHLPHIQRDDTPHFINFATHERWVLPHAARSIALDSCRHDHGRTMHLHIVVIMPDHVYLVLSPLIDYDRRRVYPLSEILWAIKSASAHRINKLLGRSGSVWQEEYFDTAMRRSESLEQKMEYVRQNPVRAGIVARAEDYEWSWELPRPRAAAALQILGK
jgi:REP element-mobilizing transposase RayT